MRIRQWDGVRALAILLVYAEHAFGLKMGWAGVDLFFVLSGLLITRILRQDRYTPNYWGRFYLKRAARILPPLLVLFLVASAYPSAARAMWLGVVLFASNFVRLIFPHAHTPLFITWSLAIEEQFYLLWPFAVKFLNTRQLTRLLIGILVMEPLLRGIATPFTHSWEPTYYLTPFRIDGLALGSLLALLLENERAKARIARFAAPAFFASMGMLLAGMALFPSFRRPANSVAFNSLGYSLVILACASVICYSLLHEKSIVSRILSLSGLTFLGTISYGIYLYHGVFIENLEVPGHLIASRLVALAAVIGYCWLSFYFLEQPTMRWAHKVVKERFPSRTHVVPNALTGNQTFAMMETGAEMHH